MNAKQLQEVFLNQPVQWHKEQSDLEKLKERWVSLIRCNAGILINYAHDKGERDKLPQPELHDIANEIEAFFTGLTAKN